MTNKSLNGQLFIIFSQPILFFMNSTFILRFFNDFFCSIFVQNSSFLLFDSLISHHFGFRFHQFPSFFSIFPLFELFVLINVVLISFLGLDCLLFSLLIGFFLHLQKFLIIFLTKFIKFFLPTLLNLSFFLRFLCLPLSEEIVKKKRSYRSIEPTFIHTWLHRF